MTDEALDDLAHFTIIDLWDSAPGGTVRTVVCRCHRFEKTGSPDVVEGAFTAHRQASM